MAKVLNCKKYHKINLADHCHHHHHHHHHQQQQQKQWQEQRQRHIHITTNQCDNDNNNLQHSHLYSSSSKRISNSGNTKNNNEFIKFSTLQQQQQQQQQHVANRQQTQQHQIYNNQQPFSQQQLTSVSSFSILKNRNSIANIKNEFLPSLNPPSSLTQSPSALSLSLSATQPPPSPLPTPPQSSSPPSAMPATTCSFSAHSNGSPLPSLPSLPTSYLNLSTTYSTYSTCCVLTYNMFTAYAEAATLQLKRKTHFNKLLHVSGHPDMRSVCYLILTAFFYWGVMIRAAVATNLSPAQTSTAASHVEEDLNTKAILYSNLIVNDTRDIVSEFAAYEFGNGTNDFSGANISQTSSWSNYSLKHPVSILSVSDDTLTSYQRRQPKRREAANVPDFEDDDSSYHDDELDEYEILIHNKSALGKYIGAPCNNSKCESSLMHVTCEKDTNTCGCERNYPVQLGLTRGCDKPKKLGEQCFYDETCQYNDENSLCVQVRHNAMCQCASGFHSVSYTKPTRRVFCTQDIDELNSDLPTLLGVCVGIGVLAGLICMVLHLFSKTKYPRHRNFGDANLPPPIMYSSETGIPLTVQSGRPSSRSSIRSSGGSIGSYGNRRSSTGGVGGNSSATAGSKGILVSTSRTGSRRPSLASVHSTSSSVRSYSMMRFEKEQQQKEIRQEMKLRLARLQQHQQQQQHQQHLSQYKPQIIIGDTAVSMQHGATLSRITMATPSPITPNSTDELLPAVDESQEYQHKMDVVAKPPFAEKVASATISAIKNVAASAGTNQNVNSTINAANANASSMSMSTTTAGMDLANAAYIGPCNSSNEAL